MPQNIKQILILNSCILLTNTINIKSLKIYLYINWSEEYNNSNTRRSENQFPNLFSGYFNFEKKTYDWVF